MVLGLLPTGRSLVGAAGLGMFGVHFAETVGVFGDTLISWSHFPHLLTKYKHLVRTELPGTTGHAPWDLAVRSRTSSWRPTTVTCAAPSATTCRRGGAAN